MKDVFVRELRENLKWAVIIAIVLLFEVLREIKSPTPSFLFDISQGFLVIFAPVAGVLMGAAQSLFDTKADNWAFSVHRPVSRRANFMGKCLAGLVLLYAGLLAPCAIATIWAARPGHLPIPFQGRMLLPLLADILGAGCYYFAAMIVVLRRARWFGTRILPIGIAVATSAISVMFMSEFWQAMLLILFVQATGAIAAWGIYAANGAPEQSPLTRIALAVMMYPGGIAACLMIAGTSELFFPNGTQWSYYQVDREGDPIVATLHIQNGERRYTFTYPAGHPIPKYDALDIDDPAASDTFLRFGSRLWDDDSVPWPLNKFAGTDFRSLLPGIVPLNAVAPPNIRLRFAALYNLEKQRIELYDPISRAYLGAVTPAGFTAAPAQPADHFPGTPLNLFSQRGRRVLAFPTVAYWVELEQRRVRPLFTATPDDPLYSAAQLGTPADPTIVLATHTRLHLLKPDGTERFSAGNPLNFSEYVMQPALLSNGHLVVQTWVIPTVPFKVPQLFEFAPDGTVIRHTELPPIPPQPGPKAAETVLNGTIFPLAFRPLIAPWMLDEVLDIRAVAYRSLFLGTVLTMATLAAIATLLIARRYALGLPRTIAWTAASFLLGPANVVVLLGVYERPAREHCALCGKPRLTTQRLCNHCQAALPPPPTDGTEIFEPHEETAAMS